MSRKKLEGIDGTSGVATPEKPKEPKDVRFRRLANRRVPQALKRLDAVANLATRANYDYSDEQAARIVVVLREAVNELERKFSGVKTNHSFEL